MTGKQWVNSDSIYLPLTAYIYPLTAGPLGLPQGKCILSLFIGMYTVTVYRS